MSHQTELHGAGLQEKAISIIWSTKMCEFINLRHFFVWK
jgi:hypothetical protein